MPRSESSGKNVSHYLMNLQIGDCRKQRNELTEALAKKEKEKKLDAIIDLLKTIIQLIEGLITKFARFR